MPQQLVRSILTMSLLTAASTLGASAQGASPKKPSPQQQIDNWPTAQLVARSEKHLDVVTLDQPRRRQNCRIQSFSPDKLVCTQAFESSHTYLPQQVLALIVPGDGRLRLSLFLGFNAGLGAAIWGTVVLAAICPPCAAATGVAALLFFGAAGSNMYADGQSDRLLYLAPGQQPTIRLRAMQSVYPVPVTPSKDSSPQPASSTPPAQPPTASQKE